MPWGRNAGRSPRSQSWCTAGVPDVTLSCLSPFCSPSCHSSQPWMGQGGKIRSQGEKCSGNPARKPRGKHPALLSHQGLYHSQLWGTRGTEKPRDISSTDSSRWAKPSSSALETSAPRSSGTKFKLVLQHEEKNCFVSASKEQIQHCPTPSSV